MLILFPEDPGVMPKQPLERKKFYFNISPDHAFAIQRREDTNNLKSWRVLRESFNPKALRFVILTQAREGYCQ